MLLHNDLDIPFAKEGTEPASLTQMNDLLRRHPDTTIYWAHVGMGSVVNPVRAGAGAAERSLTQLQIVEEILSDPSLDHVYFDISWDEVAKYIVETPESLASAVAIIQRHANRFLFGTDVVAPPGQKEYLGVYEMYQPLWEKLAPDVRGKVLKGNYERLFDGARERVRAWERANPGSIDTAAAETR